MTVNILCYGDSNTWGWDASTLGRYGRRERWTGALQHLLGENYYVIEEGLSGRTTVWDDPIEEHKNGKTYLLPCLETHQPLDLVILMLGTNDLKHRFSLTAFDIANGCATLIRHIQRSTTGRDDSAPMVLLLAPPPPGELEGDLRVMFAGGHEKAALFDHFYSAVARDKGCAYLNTGDFLEPDPVDGVHLTRDGHRLLAEKVADKVKEIL